jgi:hypothetical protein
MQMSLRGRRAGMAGGSAIRPTMAGAAQVTRRLVAGQRQRSASGYLPRQERSGEKREQKTKLRFRRSCLACCRFLNLYASVSPWGRRQRNIYKKKILKSERSTHRDS